MCVLSQIVAMGFVAAADTPENPSDASARQQAAQELAKNKYDTEASILSRLITWLKEHLNIRIFKVSEASTADVIITILALLALITIIVVCVRLIRSRKSKNARTITPHDFSHPLFNDMRSSDELFTDAEKFLTRGEFDSAVIDSFRGIIRLLAERQTISIHPGLTASEASQAASAALGYSELFSSAAACFNRVYFSDAHAHQEECDQLFQLREHVRSSIDTPHAHEPTQHAKQYTEQPHTEQRSDNA